MLASSHLAPATPKRGRKPRRMSLAAAAHAKLAVGTFKKTGTTSPGIRRRGKAGSQFDPASFATAISNFISEADQYRDENALTAKADEGGRQEKCVARSSPVASSSPVAAGAISKTKKKQTKSPNAEPRIQARRRVSPRKQDVVSENPLVAATDAPKRVYDAKQRSDSATLNGEKAAGGLGRDSGSAKSRRDLIMERFADAVGLEGGKQRENPTHVRSRHENLTPRIGASIRSSTPSSEVHQHPALSFEPILSEFSQEKCGAGELPGAGDLPFADTDNDFPAFQDDSLFVEEDSGIHVEENSDDSLLLPVHGDSFEPNRIPVAPPTASYNEDFLAATRRSENYVVTSAATERAVVLILRHCTEFRQGKRNVLKGSGRKGVSLKRMGARTEEQARRRSQFVADALCGLSTNTSWATLCDLVRNAPGFGSAAGITKLKWEDVSDSYRELGRY